MSEMMPKMVGCVKNAFSRSSGSTLIIGSKKCGQFEAFPIYAKLHFFGNFSIFPKNRNTFSAQIFRSISQINLLLSLYKSQIATNFLNKLQFISFYNSESCSQAQKYILTNNKYINSRNILSNEQQTTLSKVHYL